MAGSFLSHALTTLFILFQFATCMSPCLATRPIIPTETNTEYIKKSCATTTYPHLCYTSLSTYATRIQNSPKRLASTALTVSLSAAQSTSESIKNLLKSHGLTPREAAAMADCVEEFGDSVDELRRSVEEMAHMSGGGSEFEFHMSNIQTWVSAALTDDDTCTDGFTGKAVNGEVKTIVRKYVLKVAHFTSNALALINSYASTHGPIQLHLKWVIAMSNFKWFKGTPTNYKIGHTQNIE